MKGLVPILCGLLLFCGCSGGSRDDNVLVRYEGGVLTKEDVAAHLASLKRSSRFRDKPEQLTPEFVFEHALNMEMIIAKGLSEELHRDPDIRNELHQQMSDLFLKLMEERLVTPIDRAGISDAEVRKFYDDHKDQYQEKTRYSLRAFSVAPAKAAEAVAAIREGKLDFPAAAAEYAEDEAARKDGGQTGTRTLRRFQPSWQPVVEKLKVGEVAGPEQIDGKTYLLLLEAKTEPRQYSFEEKQEYVRNDVLYQRYRDQWQQVYDGLRKQFKVKIDEPRLKEFYQTIAGGKGEKPVATTPPNRKQPDAPPAKPRQPAAPAKAPATEGSKQP